jgi:hypothetical protein
MASFPACSIRDNRFLDMERKGFLPHKELSRSRFDKDGDVPLPRDDELVVLAPFYEREFRLPLHPFV